MAFSSFSKLTPRNQSTLVIDVLSLVNQYSLTFPARTKKELKALAQNSKAIYWLEDKERKPSSIVIVDILRTLTVDEIELVNISHIISKIQGEMHRIISHVFEDYREKNILLLCNENIGMSLNLENFSMQKIPAALLTKKWSGLANYKTDYYNVKNEPLINGIIRRGHSIFIKLNQSTLDKIKSSNPKLYKSLTS